MKTRTIASTASLVFALCFACVKPLPASAGQNPFLQVKKIPLTVTAGPGVSSTWKVKSAYLEEDLSATTGYFEIQNVSSEPVQGANFYGEYYDSLNRLCFSLVFSLDKNLEKRNGPFSPAEVRKLYSTAVFIAPAVEPAQVRLFSLPQPTSAAGQRFSDAPPVQAPITIQARSTSGTDVWLGSEVDSSDGRQVMDLILAEVTVSSSGHIQNVETLDASSERLRAWFSKFVANLSFYPATTAGMSATGKTLLLLRSVVLRRNPSSSSLQPAASPWVVSYAAQLGSESAVPPINIILFERPPTRVKEGGSEEWTKVPAAPPELFQSRYGASDWCPGISIMVQDPASSDHYHRELVIDHPNH